MYKYIQYFLSCLLVLLQINVSANVSNSDFFHKMIGKNENSYNLINQYSYFKIKYAEPDIIFGFDNIVWNVNHESFNIIENDKYRNSNGLDTNIVLGTNGASIETVGNWTNGVSLNTQTGIVTVDPSIVTSRPQMMFYYKVCVDGFCKNNSFSFQEKQDVLSINKTNNSESRKNGEILNYVIEISNSSNKDALVRINEALLNTENVLILDKNIVEFNSWNIKQIKSNEEITLSSNYLTVNEDNNLIGTVTIPAEGSLKLTISLKLNAIIENKILSKTEVTGLNVSENYFENNSSIENLNVDLVDNDLSLMVFVQNEKTFVEDNVFTIRVTNVGKNPIISNGNNIKVSFNLPNTSYSGVISNEIIPAFTNSYGQFTHSDDYIAGNTSRDHFFKLNNNITINPGEFQEIKFKKERGFGRLNVAQNQIRTINFNLEYSNPVNLLNNSYNLKIFNSPNPGEIAFDNSNGPTSKYTCYNGSVIISNKTSASSNVQGAGAGLKYKYEVSRDNGINWEFLKDLDSENEQKPDKVFSDTNNVTIPNITEKTIIRRFVYNTESEELNSVSNIITVEPYKLDLSLPNNVNSFIVAGQSYSEDGDLLPVTYTLPQGLISVNGTNSNNNVELTYYNQNGENLGNTPPTLALSEGEHRFTLTAKSIDGAPVVGCEVSQTVVITVYDVRKCNIYTKRTFATHVKSWSSGLSGVTNPEQAIPQDYNGEIHVNRANAATLTGGVVLLGIGAVGVDLYFTDESGKLLNLKNKKVVIKLGEQYSGLKVAGGLSVRAIKTNRTVNNLSVAPNLVGATKGVKGGVLDALKGDNVFEYSFIPATTSGAPVEFNGVRIQLGSLIGVADLASVFYAYIEEEDTITNNGDYCTLINSDIIVSPPSSLKYPDNQRDVDESYVKSESDKIENKNIKLNRSAEDAYWGNYSEVLNVASSLSSVVFPYYSIDDDYDSYTLFNATAGVLNMQFLRAKLRQAARPGDQVQITLAYPNINVLNLSLLQLGNFKIVYYHKGAKVGEEPLEKFRVLDIGLFNFKNKRRAILSRPVNFIYDEVELQQFNTVSVNLGDGLHVHDIRVNPMLAFSSQQDPKDVTPVCVAEPLIIEKPDFCTSYRLSFARVTKFGTDNYKDINGNDLRDYKGDLIYPILEVTDIKKSELQNLGVLESISSNFNDDEVVYFDSSNYQDELKAFFDINFAKLFSGTNYDGNMLIKLQAVRKGCDFGEPQYLRVDFKNCNSAVINPDRKSVV